MFTTLTKSHVRLLRRIRVWHVNRHYRPNNDTLKAVIALFSILAVWSWAMNEDYKDQIHQEQLFKNAYQRTVLNCAEQAVNGGTTGFVVGKELFGMDCYKLGNNAYEGVKK